MRPRIDGDRVRFVGEMTTAEQAQLPTLQVEHRDHTTFAGDVESLQARIEGQHIGVAPGAMHGKHAHVAHVHQQQSGVAVAGDESEARGRIEQQAVVVVAGRRQPIALHDRVAARVDRHDLVARLYVDENSLADGVVLRVAHLAAHRDGDDPPVAARIDDGFGLSRLVGDEQLMGARRVGHAIGVNARGSTGDHAEGPLGNGLEPVAVGRRREHLVQRRHRKHSMHAGNIRNVRDHPCITQIDRGDDAGAEMRNEQQVPLRIDRRVVESVGPAGQRQVRVDDAQRQRGCACPGRACTQNACKHEQAEPSAATMRGQDERCAHRFGSTTSSPLIHGLWNSQWNGNTPALPAVKATVSVDSGGSDLLMP